MVIDIVTILPGLVRAALGEGIVGRAIERGLVTVGVRDLRAFTTDRHRTVDDVPYGGGPGMVLKAQPVFEAVDAITAERGTPATIVLLTPQGARFDQAAAARLAARERLVLVCGRYEGIDERVSAGLGAEELSIGDYVLTGGELPALVVVDAVTRLVPGVVGDEASVAHDSFSDGWLDHPHYTRPVEVRGLRVPDVLVSGHHEHIRRWRRREAIRRTRARRPDLLARAVAAGALDGDEEARQMLAEVEADAARDAAEWQERKGPERSES